MFVCDYVSVCIDIYIYANFYTSNTRMTFTFFLLSKQAGLYFQTSNIMLSRSQLVVILFNHIVSISAAIIVPKNGYCAKVLTQIHSSMFKIQQKDILLS